MVQVDCQGRLKVWALGVPAVNPPVAHHLVTAGPADVNVTAICLF